VPAGQDKTDTKQRLYLEYDFKPVPYLHVHQTALVNLVANAGRLKCLSSGKILFPLTVEDNKSIIM